MHVQQEGIYDAHFLTLTLWGWNQSSFSRTHRHSDRHLVIKRSKRWDSSQSYERGELTIMKTKQTLTFVSNDLQLPGQWLK